jgi:hypothetical protein
LIVIESAGAAASFKRNFDAQFASGEALPIGPGQGNRVATRREVPNVPVARPQHRVVDIPAYRSPKQY